MTTNKAGIRERRRHRGDNRVTIQDVAKQAGVAPITVSRVLNTPEKVSVKLRERVDHAVQALGYVPNLIAGGLASAGTRVIPVVVPSLSILTFIEVIHGIQETLEAAGYQVLLGSTDFDLDREAALMDSVLGYSPSGVILTGLQHRESAVRRLKAWGRPVVEIMELGDTCIDMCVGVQNAEAGACMANHLLERGYRRIAFLGAGMARDYRARQRFEGHRETLKSAGVECDLLFQCEEPSSYDAGRNVFLEALEKCPDLEAMHFANDNLAAGAIMEANRQGIRIPGDLAIGGYLGLSLGEHLSPRLTTVTVPRYEMGVEAARLLLARLEGRSSLSDQVDIGYELTVREST
ncbi:LacI family transcription regulator [Litchfieldella anticariensis FP35 = DSM 16096]|uniref:LacI family transcription regulator n=1 Tax=Litchfieldella anticariensis (strain DSM 16096 / CECT 5854 / CIP 108499 / LMG 22089 / FP35) TaxID=1121939 RepID=S2L7A3_LITA3|nr:LacI family DNA-binding transcriptional regulator [Halomonas anticariensis]EPC00616.1 LacI family transcription regulator [Halomonas anticariensis FP35 = DSM 16096]